MAFKIRRFKAYKPHKTINHTSKGIKSKGKGLNQP